MRAVAGLQAPPARGFRRAPGYAILFAFMGTTSRPASSKRLRPDDGRIRRGRRTRARIREAARGLFRERGFDATTLRAIAARAGLGASSIYRHIRSKEELLVDELAERQERAWRRLRREAPRELPVRERLRRLLDAEHALLAEDPDLTLIALRATTHPEARVARRVLALEDRTVGLLAEALQRGRLRGELRREVEPVTAARAVVHVTRGARLAWANGLLSAEGCRAAVASGVDLLFRGLQAPERAEAPDGPPVR